MISLRNAITTLSERHAKFIEANYHLSHRRLIEERRQLLREGEVHSESWVEATPSYVLGRPLVEQGLPRDVTEILNDFSKAGAGVYERLYVHQTDSLKQFFVHGKDLLVSTGTGSGKTEIFLYAILGMLAGEAERSHTAQLRAIRAIILYPMNALVADQLGRLRRMFGNEVAAAGLQQRFGRRVQFGMYTSRTPYHGLYDEFKNERRVRPLVKYFYDLEQMNPNLFAELREKGRVPSKDLAGFLGGIDKESRYRTQPADCELLTRQEMHSPNRYGGAPDILVTNYSMLEYMLLRPIEQPLFESTREWLDADEANKLVIVIDEAHLYRGAQGAEVALLVQRLLQHLRVDRTRVRFILTSASLGRPESARSRGPRFAADLTTSDPADFTVITGARLVMGHDGTGDATLARNLAKLAYRFDGESIASLGSDVGWHPAPPETDEELRAYLGVKLAELPVFGKLYNLLSSGPTRLGRLAEILFPDVDKQLSADASLNLIHLGTQAYRAQGEKMLQARLHIFFRGLPPQYVCLNPDCGFRRARDDRNDLLGRIYLEPRFSCECGGRVFELMSHRTCGAAFIRAFRQGSARELDPTFLWSETKPGTDFDELHVLIEPPQEDSDREHVLHAPLSEQFPPQFLDILTGHLTRSRTDTEGRFIKVWIPPVRTGAKPRSPWSWKRCPACGSSDWRPRTGSTNIMNLETKGEETFANLVSTAFLLQPPAPMHEGFPNQGRKVLCFSDSRQKAARLARDLQRAVERDSLREILVDSWKSLPKGSDVSSLFAAILVKTARYGIAFFDDGDALLDGYEGSRSHFTRLQKELGRLVEDYDLGTVEEVPVDRDARSELDAQRPPQYDSGLLRLLGDKYYSIYGTLVGYLEPTEAVLNELISANPALDRRLLRAVVIEILRRACEERAFDPLIPEEHRRKSRISFGAPLGYPRDGGEGLDQTEIVPKDLRELLKGDVSEETWIRLIRSLKKSGRAPGVPKLFCPTQSLRYVVNPEATVLHLALKERWYRCDGCRQFAPIDISGKCPDCGGTVREVDAEDLRLSARKALYREPCLEVYEGRRQPFSLRSEEHSAQLSSKDRSEVFSKSEKYELLFQDVVTGENPPEQPIDVLSCTTTMEVGIDIGSLTGVAMRTVPPLAANYQQRAGRAGRRGSALSTIITFADNSPHETYHFLHPETLIGAEPSKPIVYVGNRKICERHVNASLLQRFFQSAPIEETADVFSSLGATAAFFQGQGPQSFPAFRNWISTKIEGQDSQIGTEIGKLLPTALSESFSEQDPNWRTGLVRETARKLIERLQELAQSSAWSHQASEDDNLLSCLLDAAILPTFSFPIDVCTFTVSDFDKKKKQAITRYEMSAGLMQALSDYVPGRQVVVDKRTYTSYGLHFPFATNLIDRASGQDWSMLNWLNYCDDCETIFEEQNRDLGSLNTLCPIPGCGSTLKSFPTYRPLGFSPQVEWRGVREGEREEAERFYPESAQFPLPISAAGPEPGEEARTFHNATVLKMPNKQLLVVNYGPEEDGARVGFQVCQLCGAIGGTEALPNRHDRPYPRDHRLRGAWPKQCNGATVQTTFSYKFQTDLALLRVQIGRPFGFSFAADWFGDAARSFSEALVLGATRALRIDPGELAGNFRSTPKYASTDLNVQGYLEFFLYDTTPGGAGFAAQVSSDFGTVLSETKKLLSCTCSQSCHACLRTYENRHWHRLIDRHLASSILEYTTTGMIPDVEIHRANQLLTRLGLSLELVEPGAQVRYSPQGLTVEAGSKRTEVKLRPCLREIHADTPGVVDVSDFDLLHDLPTVAHTVLRSLRQERPAGGDG